MLPAPSSELQSLKPSLSESSTDSGPMLLKLELLNWSSSQSVVSGSNHGAYFERPTQGVYFEVCARDDWLSACIDSRVWVDSSAINGSFSAVYVLDDIKSLQSISIRCVYHSIGEIPSDVCDLQREDLLHFAFFNHSEVTDLPAILTSEGDTEQSTWRLSAQPTTLLPSVFDITIPHQHEHCTKANWKGGWNELIVDGCPASLSIDSDNDTFSDLVEVECRSDLRNASSYPVMGTTMLVTSLPTAEDMDGDGFCNLMDLDADNDGVYDRWKGDIHADFIDDCVEVLDEAFVDLDGDGCSRLSNDADLDGDGVPNAEDACMTLSSTTKGVFLDEGCPVPKRLPLRYTLLAGSSALLFLLIRDIRRSNQATHTGDMSTDDYVGTVINIESMPPTAIIRLGQELGFEFKGSRKQQGIERKRYLIYRAIDAIRLEKKIHRADVMKSHCIAISFLLICTMVLGAGLNATMIERDEALIEAQSEYVPRSWGLPDYKEYFATGAKAEMVGFDSITFMFDDDRDTHNLVFSDYIDTDCSIKRSGVYTIQGDYEQADGSYSVGSCEFSVTFPVHEGGSIRILTDEVVLDGWFLGDPTIDVRVNGESIAPNRDDQSTLRSGGPTATFDRAGKNTLVIDASLYSDDDRFDIIGLVISKPQRGLVIDQESSSSLNAEIRNGEQYQKQLDRHNGGMVLTRISLVLVLVLSLLISIQGGERKQNLQRNLVSLNKILVSLPRSKSQSALKRRPFGKEIRSRVSVFTNLELAHFAAELGIRSSSYRSTTVQSGTYNGFNRLQVGAKRREIEQCVVDKLTSRDDPLERLDWFEGEDWNNGGMGKRLVLVTGEEVPHHFPLKCGNPSLDDHDAVLHTSFTWKTATNAQRFNHEDMVEDPFVLLGAKCAVENCSHHVELRPIPTVKLKISAKGPNR